MPQYNPSNPCVLGMEWFVDFDYADQLNSLTDVLGAVNTAVTDDDIESLWLSICGIFGPACLALEVYDITNGLPTFYPVEERIYYPGVDRYNSQCFGYGPYSGGAMVPPNTAPWIFPALANPTPNPGIWPNSGRSVPDDSFAFNIYGHGFEYLFGAADLAGTQTGRWITSLKVTATVNELVDYYVVGAMTITPYIQVAGQRFMGNATTINGEQQTGVPVSTEWPFNPLTGLPWTPVDLDAFDAAFGDPAWGAGWIVNPTGSSNNLATVNTATLSVMSAPTDPRLRIGAICSRVPGPVQGWTKIRLLDPQTALPQSLVLIPDHKYLYAFRKTVGSVLVTLCSIVEQGAYLPGPPHWLSIRPPVVGPGEPTTGPLRIRALEGWMERCFGTVLERVGGAISLDSQAYSTESPDAGGFTPDMWPFLGLYFDNCPVYGNDVRRIEQEFTATSTDEYAYVSVLACLRAGSADHPMTVRVRRRSDDALMGEVVFTDADLEFPRTRWQRLGRAFAAPVVFTAGVQYYFDIRSAVTADQAWNVQIANGGIEPGPPGGPPLGTEVSVQGEGIDQVSLALWGAPQSEENFMTAVINIASVPDTPVGFDALPHGEDACGFDWVLLDWAPLPGGALDCGFGQWEIQRSDDGGLTWGCVATITDPAVTSIEDWESPRNQLVRYRMRVVRSDHAPSEWTAEITAMAELTQPGILFTSNEAPELSVFYPDIDRERTYEFPEKVVILQPYMRDYQVAFRELEDRGTTFSTTVVIRGCDAGPCVADPCYDYTLSGTGVFGPLLRIARESLSYVAVHNEAGDRWFANVQTPTGVIRRGRVDPANPRLDPDGYYRMAITVTEVTDRSSCVDASSLGSGSGSGS